MSFSDLPTLNACLNGASAFFLSCGYYFIRRRNQIAHRNCMLAALCTSSLFLVFYLIYHYSAGATRFAGQGWIRPVYFGILLTHTVLAAVIVPLVLVTLLRAWKGHFEKHKAIARWTWPIWMYVSVTGVIIYLMLYHWYPSRAI
jgi:uncharacterized membrane protein YozB (DUF420 family)